MSSGRMSINSFWRIILETTDSRDWPTIKWDESEGASDTTAAVSEAGGENDGSEGASDKTTAVSETAVQGPGWRKWRVKVPLMRLLPRLSLFGQNYAQEKLCDKMYFLTGGFNNGLQSRNFYYYFRPFVSSIFNLYFRSLVPGYLLWFCATKCAGYPIF